MEEDICDVFKNHVGAFVTGNILRIPDFGVPKVESGKF